MKVPDNTLNALRSFYHSELSAFYEEREAKQMFKLACESYLGLPFNRPVLGDLRISESEMLLFFGLIKRLKKNEPLQYILGEAFFCELKLKVSPAVLIPRPETEELVQWVISDFPTATKIVDLCAGSGCIPLALKAHYKNAQVTGVELSPPAVEIARENSQQLQLEVEFVTADVLTLASDTLENGIDILTSNPPYILHEESSELHPNVLTYEPHLALFAPKGEGFVFYKKIAQLAAQVLKPGGKVYVEIHHLHAPEVSEIFSEAGLTEITVKHDISNRARMIRATRQ